jgi:hypothetical protein
VEYVDADQTFSILGLLPAPEFVDRLSANLNVEASAKALVSESGALEIALALPDDHGLKPFPVRHRFRRQSVFKEALRSPCPSK